MKRLQLPGALDACSAVGTRIPALPLTGYDHRQRSYTWTSASSLAKHSSNKTYLIGLLSGLNNNSWKIFRLQWASCNYTVYGNCWLPSFSSSLLLLLFFRASRTLSAMRKHRIKFTLSHRVLWKSRH